MGKFSILIALAAASALLFAACGGSTGDTTTPATTPPVVVTNAPITDEIEVTEDDSPAEETDSSSAGGSVIDFEDGNFDFVALQADEEGNIDGANAEISVVEFGGSKQLKVQRLAGEADAMKPRFDITAILGDAAPSCARITMDLTVEATNPEEPFTWASGTIGTGGENITWGQTDWAYPLPIEEPEIEGVLGEQFEAERRFLLPSHRFDTAEGNHMLVMTWDLGVDFSLYIDNIKFWDDDGNLIEVLV